MAVYSVAADSNRFGLPGLARSRSHAFECGLSVSPGISLQRRRQGAADPLLQKDRTDRPVRLSVNRLHRAFQYLGLAPCIGYSQGVKRSNIHITE